VLAPPVLQALPAGVKDTHHDRGSLNDAIVDDRAIARLYQLARAEDGAWLLDFWGGCGKDAGAKMTPSGGAPYTQRAILSRLTRRFRR
jgi:hypothetical protein